jgi:glycyl-tRNA synthetase beta chain
MTEAKNLLVELFVEELPPKALMKLGEEFAKGLFSGLEQRDFLSADSVRTAYASPRRLAVHITAVRAVSEPRPRPPTTLMPVAVGLGADGKPTPQLVKRIQTKLYHADVDVDWVMRERVFVAEEGGKKVLKHREDLAAGSALLIGLERALKEALDSLPIPKVMTYQLHDGWTDVKFVRPVHSLMALHGSESVKVRLLGLEAGNTTRGHRFEAAVDPVTVNDADSYERQMLEDGAVIASFEARRAEIVRQLASAAEKVGGGVHVIDDVEQLLDEVTGLVERPNVLTCQFEPEFLEVPQECLILTMKANQKYFPLLDAQGKLTNRFLVVSNISPDDASAVIQGNERVVRPRLADAKFFFDQDRKKKLAERVPSLSKVTYHNKLGSQHERMLRVKAISEWIAERIGADVDLAGRAAFLAKADLVTDMVGEFPELQGVMGGYYARYDGEDSDVAQAIADQYVLQSAHSAPTNLVSVSLDIADRVETLIGIWGIGLKPTGEKDPFALRRHALSLINRFELLALAAFIEDAPSGLLLPDLLEFAHGRFSSGLLGPNTVSEVAEFIYDRLQNRLTGLQGQPLGVVDAVLSQRPPLQQVASRIKAVRAFAALPEAPALAAANKRISNILKKAAAHADPHVSELLLQEPAEKALYAAMQIVAPRAQAQFEVGDYAASLQTLAALREPVDAFFDGVMVNADQPDLRLNRLGLLASLHQAMNRVADLSRLAA